MTRGLAGAAARGSLHGRAVVPARRGRGALLADYSLRLGDALLRHRAEIAERANRVEAERASKVKSEFIATISHELRTPLNSILGFSNMLRSANTAPVEGARIAQYAGFIHHSAEGLLAVVNDVITISKIQAGKLNISVSDVYADEVLETAAAWAQARIRGSRRRLIMKIEKALPPMRADLDAMRNVFERLLSNAIKFTGDDGAIALFGKKLKDDRIMLCVCDTGIGMTPNEIAIALTPFGQADSRLSRKTEGTGLGLPIAKSLVELQGGALAITSRKGGGTDVALLMQPARLECGTIPGAEA